MTRELPHHRWSATAANSEAFSIAPEHMTVPRAKPNLSPGEASGDEVRQGAFEDTNTNDQRWDLAFIGIIGYLVVDYMRLPAVLGLHGLSLAKVVVGLALIGYLVSPKRQAASRGARAIDGLFVSLLAAVTFSAVLARYLDLGLDRLVDALRYVIVYFLISRIVSGKWRLHTFLLLWLLLNFKIGQFVIRSYLIERSLPWQTSLNIAKLGVGAGTTGFFSNASDLGVAMCVVWPVAVYVLIARTTKFTRVVAAATAAASLGAILVCGSRGALLGAAVIVLIGSLRAPQKIVAAIMIVVLAAGVYICLPEGSKQRWDSAKQYEKDDTSYHRILLWKAGIAMFLDHPLFGVGPGNYPIVRKESYPIPNVRMDQFMSVAHSTYIEALSELGFAGALIILLLWLSFFRLNAQTRALVLRRDPKDKYSLEYCLACGLDLGLVGFLASAAFVSVLWYPHIFILLAISVSLHRAVQGQFAMQAPPVPEAGAIAEVASN